MDNSKQIRWQETNSWMRIGHLALALMIVLLLLGGLTLAVLARPLASITLSLDPGAAVAIEPGEIEQISWQIAPSEGKPPLNVNFTLRNQSNVLLHEQDYPGSSGLSIVFSYTLPVTYTVPDGMPFERYTAQIIYYSSVGEEARASALFFVSQDTGALRIFKFNDRNLNGVFDGVDMPLANVLFQTRFPFPFGDTVFFGLSDSNGEIVYDQLGTGVYTVTETPPPGTLATTPTQRLIQVSKDVTATVAFGNAVIPGSLEVFKFEDRNGNGQRDAGEPPLSGVLIHIESDCGQLADGVTGVDGYMRWSNRCVGEWQVTESPPAGYIAIGSVVQNVQVQSQMTTTVTFANRAFGAMRVFKFEDRNGNGLQDAGEPPWSGIDVNWSNEFGDNSSCTTNAQGLCDLLALPAGAYTVTETLPAFTQAVLGPSFQTSVNAGITTTVTFANRRLGNLHIHVFFDVNGDGLQDLTETGLAGITVGYSNEYGASANALSDAVGDAFWSNLGVGSYITMMTVPMNCVATTPSSLPTSITPGNTTVVQFGLRCLLYLPLLWREYPPPTPTPTITPPPTATASSTATATATPTATPTRTPTSTPTLIPTPRPPATTIPIPHPKSIAVDEIGNRLFIASRTTHRIYVVDGSSNAVIAQVAVGNDPYGLDVNLLTRKLYVANFLSGSVSVINIDNLTVTRTIALGANSQPTQVAINQVTNRIYVALHGRGQVAVIDGATDGQPVMVDVGAGAFDVAVDQAFNRIFVTVRDAGYLAVLDGATNSEILSRRTFPGGLPYSLAFDPLLRRLYVVYAPYQGLVLDAKGIPLTGYLPPAQAGQTAMAISDPDQVAVFEAKPTELGRITTLTVGKAGAQGGVGIAANPTTANVFVSNSAANTLSVIDGVGLYTLATLPMPGDPGDVAVNPILNRVFISNRSADIVQMLYDTY